MVHNETSTGCTSRIEEVRKALNSANHEALLMVDTISGLGSMEYKHDEWGVDITVSGSQKGLMLPPGLSFNAISEKAFSDIALKDNPGGSISPFWDPETVISTPHSSCLYSIDPKPEIVSTINNAS